MNENGNKMTIGELADAAGVTVRTIRYYVNEGLLPQPKQHGRYTLYEPWYLDRLELIKRWKDAYLPLKEIRVRIQPLSNEDVRQALVNHAAKMAVPVPAASVKPEPWEGEIPQTEEDGQEPESALEYIHKVQHKNTDQPQDVQAISDYIRRARRDSRRDVRPAPVPQPTPTPRPIRRGTEWRRIQVFPGLELNVSEDVSRRYWRELDDLIAWINQHFPQAR